MKDILLRNNIELKRQANILLKTINEKTVVREIVPYKNWLLSIIENRKDKIEQNFDKLQKMELIEAKLNQLPNHFNKSTFDLTPDILSETETIAAHINLLSARYVTPIYRGIEDDKIGLKLLDWLHKIHEETSNLPFAVSDGAFSILPDYQAPTLYFLPPIDQRGLLYLPLFFHEFGHLLYAIHEKEMDDLVKEFQLEIEDLLRPSTIHNDENGERIQQEIKTTVDTWYQWMQEFFCDAVGLVIGGESYLYAFSGYFQSGGITEFYIPKEDLENSTHPVTYVRIQLLVKRAKELGYIDSASKIMNEWEILANQYIKHPEYYGYYSENYEDILYDILTDMITGTNPYFYKANIPSPVRVLNEAWNVFFRNPNSFENWELSAIQDFLEVDFS